jgi:hypothetical protein
VLKMNPKSIAKSLVDGGGLFALGLVFLILGRAATSKAGKPPCSVANVAGMYAMAANGTILVNPFGYPPGAISSLGLINFDRQGRYHLEERVSFNGQLSDWTETGSYTVRPDCTCSVAADKGGASALVIFAGERKEALGMLTNAGTAINLTFKRID